MTSPPQPDPEDNAFELLNADRELSPDERHALAELAGSVWAQLGELSRRRSQLTYSIAVASDFAECAFEHMNVEQRATLVTADAYHCPVCNRLLKDRRTPVASSILLERDRVKQMWMRVEEAAPEDREEALQRFRRSLGL